MSAICVRGLSKHWDRIRAVDGVDFEVEAGEFTAILGPSGCGKSTTLRLVAGLEEATAGRVEIGGRDVTSLPPARRGVSMVFQSYALFPHLTVEKNILFGLSVRRVDRAERRRRLVDVAELLGLSGLLGRRPSELSGGQQQRVALGRALVAQFPVCLLDEPLSNLDAQLRAQMRTEIRAIQRRFGMTMLFVTHDQAEAMSMSDRVILMRHGKIEQHGTPAELYDEPASSFVGRFIGTPPMSIIDPADAGLPAPEGVELGIRPEHITIAASGIEADVEAVEYFGADSIVACRLRGQPVLARLPGRPGIAPGRTVRLSWPDQAIHLFDKTTGLRRATSPAGAVCVALAS